MSGATFPKGSGVENVPPQDYVQRGSDNVVPNMRPPTQIPRPTATDPGGTDHAGWTRTADYADPATGFGVDSVDADGNVLFGQT